MNYKGINSKLDKFEGFIRRSRQKGLSYRQISYELRKEHGLEVAHNTIFAFVKVRSKKRKVISMLDADQQIEVRKPFPGIVTREKQISISKEKPKGKFHYNPDEPIT